MTTLKFADTHNMVAFLSKPAKSDGFEQIVDFLNAQPIRYALTVNPTIYISCIEQFWSTGMVKTINGEVQLHALVDGKKIIISEASMRRDLKLEDEEDEAVHKELGDSLVRAATTASNTASSLEAEQDSGAKKPWGILLLKLGLRMYLKFLMIHCSQEKVPDLEKTKTTQANEIASLKWRVKKLEKKRSSRTHKLKRLYKVGLSADEDITLVNVQDDADKEMYDVGTMTGDEVFAEQEVAAKDVNLTIDEVTLAQALAALKSVKPKVKGDVIEEPNLLVNAVSASTKRSSQQPSQAEVQDKGKGKMIEPEPIKKMSKKDQPRSDEEEAKRLQDKFDEEERLAREKDEANEQEELSVEEKEKLFQQLLEQRREHFASKSAEEKRNKPPTQAQQRKITCTYLKNLEGKKLKDLKNKSFDSIQKMFDKAFKRQKVDEDKDTAELQSLMEVIPDEEEVAIDVVPLATKPPTIVDWKIHKEGKNSYFQIIRADGSSKMYLVFSQLLKSVDREDLVELYKLEDIFAFSADEQCGINRAFGESLG
ncbi:hypothetical protein Tco_0196162 [Tanacetum coccineum]